MKMKRIIFAFLSVLVILAITLAIIPTTRDEIQWRLAAQKDLTTSYESYMKAWPEGRHAITAKALYDERGWTDAHNANTVSAFELYVQLHSQGMHVAEAKDNIDSLHWQEASTSNTIRSYQSYSASHPEGRFVRLAETNSSALRNDPALYETALQIGTEASLRAFMTNYPGHRKQSEAQMAIKDITEGRDIVDLLKERKIEIKTHGSGIESVSVSMRRLVPYALTVRIPVGTYFVSANTSSQNMVTTAESTIHLSAEDWQDVSPEAACANRPRDIPESDDNFTIQRSPHQAELAKLMPILDKAGVNTETRQAAVWIITDDADYDDLGILVASQFGFGGSRVINESETVRAMRICDAAGIDITRKRIWNDKQTILSGLTDDELRNWLMKKK
jgi:hypothetical protein